MMMRTPSLRPAVCALAAALALAACGGDSTGSGRFSGRTEFLYSGDLEGEFRAQGSLPGDLRRGSFAFGQNGSSFDGFALSLVAQQDLPGSRVNSLSFTVRSPAVGTVSCSPGATDCPITAFLVLGADAANLYVEADADLYSTSGTVTIATLTHERATGTFQFAASELGAGTRQVQVTNGSFDVPLLDRAAIPFSRQAVARAAFPRSR
ncbi:MAG TPA: hypothetical protein VF665_05005 [Longimicrobium sp.]|jgi:hypothetical protein|uniref:hypothetical protein n=1 Tax=Longimicrobium sp. TaxID=2029185 RepID=UPI002EDAC939